MIRSLSRHVNSIGGLITIPGTIALGIWLLSVPMLRIDHVYGPLFPTLFGDIVDISLATADSVLSTIASAAITTLSLVYSLVLVVFTLAAGNIAPRLLRRFTNDRVNQITAGLLGGTFLYSLTVLHQTQPDFVPLMSIVGAMVLAVIFVLQLILFVHTVSKSVTIDEEIASISEQLRAQVAAMVAEDKDGNDAPDSGGEFPYRIKSLASGYLSAIDEDALLGIAIARNVTVRLLVKPGGFVVEGQSLMETSQEPEEGYEQEFNELVQHTLHVTQSRGAVHDIEYSINLLLEMALRALSPGVNDTFTAIAAFDQMSAAVSDAVQSGLRGRNRLDPDGNIRVEIPGLTLEDLLNTAIHPLRQAAAGNILMLHHIADGLTRLYEIGNREARSLIENHAELLLATCKASNPLEEDYRFLKERLEFIEKGD